MEPIKYTHLKDRKLTIIGVAIDEGQDHPGTNKAPEALRKANMHKVAEQQGWEVNDTGDITNETIEHQERCTDFKTHDVNIKNIEIIGDLCQNLHTKCYNSAKEGHFTLVLGGDHGLATGSISGLKKAHPNLKVVWIDAHGDANTPEGSPSGNYHGMPVAHLLGWIPDGHVPGFDWYKANLTADDFAYIGLRDIDPFERKMFKEKNIKVYDMDDVTEKGIGKVIDEILEYFAKDGDDHPIHISFDVDAIDPAYISQTGTKSRGGLTDREAHYIIRKLVKTGKVTSMDLVEINPEIEKDEGDREILHGDNPVIKGTKTVCLGVELIQSVLGHRLCL
jgi:arginase